MVINKQIEITYGLYFMAIKTFSCLHDILSKCVTLILIFRIIKKHLISLY